MLAILPRPSSQAVRSLRLLVVEDEALVAFEIETFLTGAGHLIVGVAESRGRALELLRTMSPQPDLALVDIRLAGGDTGLDLAADIGLLGVPVLFVSGNCPHEQGQGLAVGCLHKPFDEPELLAAVAAAAAIAAGQAPYYAPAAMHVY